MGLGRDIKGVNLFPERLPEFWMGGFVHHHTAFGFSERHRVTPGELQKEVTELGGDFVFCAGDHGCEVDGEVNPGWYEGRDYYEMTLSANEDGGVLLLPTGEYHLWFPDLISRDQTSPFWQCRRKNPDYQPFHHTLIPMIGWTDAVCRYVRENTSPALVETAERLGIVPTLNHPGLCYLTGHPDPLAIPWFKKMPYLELFNTTIDSFDYDWALYKYYLSRPESCRMGVFSGTDFNSHKGFGLSTPGNERAEHITYIHAPNGRCLESLYDAWRQRRTVAVRGRLFLEHINPVPCLTACKAAGQPEISFSVRSFGKCKVRKIEIYRNGTRVYREFTPDCKVVEKHWRDSSYEGGEARYTILVEAEGDCLITSPIGFTSDLP